ncbi:MAG: Lon-like protease helical domain-containing protein, partial [Alphaproteobacteria bacterium]
MTAPVPLPPETLFRACDPASLGFKSTDEVPDFEEILGQPRAMAAMRFGIDIRRQGYNIFVLGPPGAGRYTLIGEFLQRAANAEPRPDDWCYVFNFAELHKPRALRLPPGQGMPFRAAMAQLVDDLRVALPTALEAEDHLARQKLIEGALKERHEAAFANLRAEAEVRGLAVGQSSTGFAFVPTRDGQSLSSEAFNALPAAERNAITGRIGEMEERLEAMLRQSQGWQKESLEKLRALIRQVAQRIVDHAIEPLKRDFAAFPDVLAYLNAARDDLVRNASRFLRTAAGANPAPGAPGTSPAAAAEAAIDEDPTPFRRYQINVIVNNGDVTGAPVVYEDLPSA